MNEVMDFEETEIKVVRYGTMYGFKFFPPNTPITQEDRDNFEYYKRNKYKKNR